MSGSQEWSESSQGLANCIMGHAEAFKALAGEAMELAEKIERADGSQLEGRAVSGAERCAFEGIASLSQDIAFELAQAKRLASHSAELVSDLFLSWKGDPSFSKIRVEERDVALACIGGAVAVLEKADMLALQLDELINQGIKER